MQHEFRNTIYRIKVLTLVKGISNCMSDGNTQQDVQQRVKPILDKVAVEGLRAWLKAIGLPAPALSRASITDHIATLIVKKAIGRGRAGSGARRI
jgi:hypothetical protein